MMEISSNGLNLIKSFEGFSSTPYPDGRGLLTVGYGHKLLPGESFSNGITSDDALNLLDTDLAPVMDTVNSLVKIDLSQNEFDALLCLTYNIGCGAFRNSSLLKLLNAGDFDGASKQILLWDHSNGEVVDGLLRRRLAEQELFLKD